MDKFTTTKTDNAGHEYVSHPSFGVIGVSRVSGHCRLFQSDVRHQHFIALRVAEAELVNDGIHTSTYARKRVLEVWMSEAQFAQMITTPNVGEGVPCTIRAVQGDQPYEGVKHGRPEPPEPTPILEPYKQEMNERLRMVTDANRRAIDMVAELLGGVTKPTKTNLKTLKGELETIGRELDHNLPYVEQSLVESLEKKVANAATEFEAYVTRNLVSKGMDALRGESQMQLEVGQPKEGTGA